MVACVKRAGVPWRIAGAMSSVRRKWMPLVARGSGLVKWESATLALREQAGRTFAVAVEGRHELVARDAESGRTVATWVVVKAL